VAKGLLLLITTRREKLFSDQIAIIALKIEKKKGLYGPLLDIRKKVVVINVGLTQNIKNNLMFITLTETLVIADHLI
jgi:hypothetical protein